MMGKGRSCGAIGASVLVCVSAFILSSTLGCDTPFPDVLDDDWWPFTTVAGEIVYNDDPNLDADPNDADPGEDPGTDPGDDPEPSGLRAEEQLAFVSMSASETITLTAAGGSGDDLTYSLVTNPQHGELGPIDNGSEQTASVVYTPDAGFSGLDIFRFAVSDTAGNSSAATVTIGVYPPVEFTVEPLEGPRPLTIECSAPGLNTDFASGATYTWQFDDSEDSGLVQTHLNRTHAFQTAGVHAVALTLSLAGSAAPISCISAQTHTDHVNVVVWPQISGRVVDGQGVGIAGATVTASAGGTMSVTDANGNYVVDVPYSWTGVVSVQHNAYDFELSSRSYANVAVDVENQNFQADLKTVSVSGTVSLSGGEGLAGVAISGQGTGDSAGQNATATTNSSGNYELVVPQGWAGQITPTLDGYSISPSPLAVSPLYSDLDDQDFVATADGPDNQPPTATPGSVTTDEDTAKSIALAGSDPEGTTLSFVIVTLPGKGALKDAGNGHTIAAGELPYTLNANGNDVTYTPQQNVNGQDSFTFKVYDGGEDSDAATVEITINPVNDAPTADAQSVAAAPGSGTAITLTGSDVEQSNLSFEVVQGPSHGELTGAPPTIGYTPAEGYEGDDAFTFKVFDGEAYSAPATVSIAVATWAPPIGIPMPEFGITEKHTMYEGQTYDYGSGAEPYRDAGNGPYTYYVDNTHGSATDTNNPYGTANKPRRTIPRYLDAGDVVEIHGGPYSPSSDRFWVQGTGTEAKPIFVRGVDPANRPVLNGGVHPLGQYVIFENIKLYGAGFDVRPLLGWTVSYIGIRHIEVEGRGTYKSGERIGINSYDSSAPVHHVVCYDNYVHHNGQFDAEGEDDTPAFSIQLNSHHIWVVDNTAHDSGGDAVILAHNADFSTHHVYIGRNVFYRHRENAVDIKECEDIIVSENVMYGYAPTSTSLGEAVVMHYGTRRVWVLNNEIYDSQFGICSTGSVDLYVVGNTIHDIRRMSALTHSPESPHRGGIGLRWYNSDHVYAYNNTFYDCVTAIGADIGSSSVEIVNNIASHLIEGENGYHMTIMGVSSARSASTVKNDLFYQPGGSVRIWWGGGPYSLSGFKSASGKGAGCLDSNPKYVNVGGCDVHLQAGSPAIDAGCAHTCFDVFLNQYGFGTDDVDLDGVSRPQGDNYDMGAYETP